MHELRRRSRSTARRIFGAAAVLSALAAPQLSSAQTPHPDLANDFLGGYTGPHGDDLDILRSQVLFDGSHFLFTSDQGGPIGTTPGGIYVWGINRGTGTSPGGAFTANTKFDAIVLLNSRGGSVVRDLRTGTATPLTVFTSGNSISGQVDLSLLQSRGFNPEDYEVNMWSRNGPSADSTIADFADNQGNFAVTVTPEPATTGMLFAGLLAVGVVVRKRRRAA